MSQQFPCLVYNWVSPLRRLTWRNFRCFLLLFVFLGRLSNLGVVAGFCVRRGVLESTKFLVGLVSCSGYGWICLF